MLRELRKYLKEHLPKIDIDVVDIPEVAFVVKTHVPDRRYLQITVDATAEIFVKLVGGGEILAIYRSTLSDATWRTELIYSVELSHPQSLELMIHVVTRILATPTAEPVVVFPHRVGMTPHPDKD
jgi:hypothetical protein